MVEKILLENKVATVMGAGIGYAIASESAKEGAQVVIAELRPEKGKEATQEISQATGAKAICILTDFSVKEDVLP